MPRIRQFTLTGVLLLPLLTDCVRGQYRGSALEGTQRLAIDEPLDEVMVAGISRFALRQLQESPAHAAESLGTRLFESRGIQRERGRQSIALADDHRRRRST